MKKFRRIILFFLAYFYPSSTLGFQREAIIWGNSSKIIFGSFTLITMKSWQSIYEEVLTKSWQNIYEEVLTNHIRRSHDKVFTMKSWQIHEGEKLGEKTGEISPLHLNIIFGSFTLITMKSWQSIYEEVMTKHIRWNLDKAFTKKSWQSIYEEILTKHIRWNLDKVFMFSFDEILTKHLRWNHDKVFMFSFDEILTKHIRRNLDKAYTMKPWQIIYV